MKRRGADTSMNGVKNTGMMTQGMSKFGTSIESGIHMNIHKFFAKTLVTLHTHEDIKLASPISVASPKLFFLNLHTL